MLLVRWSDFVTTLLEPLERDNYADNILIVYEMPDWIVWLIVLLCASTQCYTIGIRHGRSRNARNLRPNGQMPPKLSAIGGGHDNNIVRLLQVVESQQQLGNNCTAGTHLNLGEGVVDRYAQVSGTMCVVNYYFRERV